VVVVTRPAALPRVETARLVASLGRLHIAVPAVVVNAVTPPGCSRCRRAAAAERREMDAIAGVLARPRRGRPAPRLILSPAVAPPPRGVRALSALGAAWRALEPRAPARGKADP
jgi:arsenite-transporting ATPase